jgi:hypothetical protein
VLVAAIGGRATLALAGALPVVAALVGVALYRRPRAAEQPVAAPASSA